VFPDIPREELVTPGGGKAIRFPVLPPKTLIIISYLTFGIFTVEQILSYVGSEQGLAKRIPVMLQRIWPPWVLKLVYALLVLGLWVALNALWSLIMHLWSVYYLGP
jgi:hypothetical protein